MMRATKTTCMRVAAGEHHQPKVDGLAAAARNLSPTTPKGFQQHTTKNWHQTGTGRNKEKSLLPIK